MIRMAAGFLVLLISNIPPNSISSVPLILFKNAGHGRYGGIKLMYVFG
jgi:hypothetical protein